MQSLRHSGDSNFQALAGLGLADMEDGNFEEAAEKFQRCLEMNPWSMRPNSARILLKLAARSYEPSTAPAAHGCGDDQSRWLVDNRSNEKWLAMRNNRLMDECTGQTYRVVATLRVK
ncbi:hypothetical protein THAOC_23779, partial [Thalassiosira oceanica]